MLCRYIMLWMICVVCWWFFFRESDWLSLLIVVVLVCNEIIFERVLKGIVLIVVYMGIGLLLFW